MGAGSIGASVVVVGSANVDQVLRVARIPGPGETVLSHGLTIARGGKGQNQAVAAARAGADVSFVAALGDDGFGALTRDGLIADGVHTAAVRTAALPTGTALIAVDDEGENTIIVEAGANALLSLEQDDRATITSARVLLLQLEIADQTVLDAAQTAHDAGVLVVLNAAPMRELPDALLAAVDVLIVNEHEAALLAAARPRHKLTDLVPVVVVTLGGAGAVLSRRGEAESRVAAPSVTVVDTTGAGDTFCGAFGAALAVGAELGAAVRFAVAAGSLAVETAGAVPSIPFRAAIDARLGGPAF
jgi:ribokinase